VGIPAEHDRRDSRKVFLFEFRALDRIRCVVHVTLKRCLGLDVVGVAFSLPNLSATSLRRTNRVLIARS
jgi:hypothetical protein